MSKYAVEFIKALRDVPTEKLDELKMMVINYPILKKENEELKTKLEFTMAYLDPKNTSFRDMMDTFSGLSGNQKDKLIDLSRALARLAATTQDDEMRGAD